MSDIMKKKAKPFIKWVGGKRQLMDYLLDNIPKDFNRYFEPFVGGGALLFELSTDNNVINDYNVELINLYKVIKEKPDELMKHLDGHLNNSEYYYKEREKDRDFESYKRMSDIERASRFIYLNKTGFNGLYRVNKKGQNNVPYGKYKNPTYYDKDNIKACQKVLQKTIILEGDFENIKEYIRKGDFVYFDPPYDPVTSTSSFTSYTNNGFDYKMQVRLKEFCDYLNEQEVYFLLSNSYTERMLELYSGYNIKLIEAKRSINSDGSKRGKVKEILVKNY